MKEFILIILSICVVSSVRAQSEWAKAHQERYEQNILKEEINGQYIPINLHDAFDQLDQLSTEAGRAKLIEGEEEIVAERLTRGLGKWIIVNWNFYEGSRYSHYLKEMGVSFPDDMAQFTIVSYYRHLKGIPLQLKERAEIIYEKRKKEQEERNKDKKVISKT